MVTYAENVLKSFLSYDLFGIVRDRNGIFEIAVTVKR